jgi:hypothetical protein
MVKPTYTKSIEYGLNPISCYNVKANDPKTASISKYGVF